MFSPQLFLGQVMHRRLRPAVNAFVYPVYFCRLPLRSLESAGNAVFSLNRFNLLSFHFVDHGARDGSHLLPWITARLAEAGVVADGEIVLQCFPRVLGYVFNPVSFWFCHNGAGQLVAVLAAVSNTFGGQHDYLIRHADGSPLGDGDTLTADKAFHVSPFCEVCGSYRFRFHQHDDRVLVRIDYADADGDLLHTAISGASRPWSPVSLLAAFCRVPWLTAGVVARIHWQALRLWLKRVPFFGAHPGKPLQPVQEKTS